MPMNYTEVELFGFMDSGRCVRVTTNDGQQYEGRCWAYSAITNQEDFDISEATLEIGATVLLQSQIERIEFA